MSSKVKCHKVNWKAIYDLLYVSYINFDDKIYRLWDTTCCTLCDLYLTFRGHLRSNVLMQFSQERSDDFSIGFVHSLSYNSLSPRYWSILLEYVIYIRLSCAGIVWCGKVVIHVCVCIFIFMCCTIRQILIIFGTTPVCVIYVYRSNCLISQCIMMQIEINWLIDWLIDWWYWWTI